MQYTDNEAALIGGLISTYFFQPAVSASLKDVRLQSNFIKCRGGNSAGGGDTTG